MTFKRHGFSFSFGRNIKKHYHKNFNDNSFGIGNNKMNSSLTKDNILQKIDSNFNFQTLFLLGTFYQFDISKFLLKLFTITTKNDQVILILK